MTTAFVLSGGGSLGAVQVGMLQALAAHDIRPDLLVGTSAGALNAAWVADHGMSPESLADLTAVWAGIRRSEIFPVSVAKVLRGLLGLSTALTSPHGLEELIRSHASMVDLTDAMVPLHTVATDVLSGEDVLLSTGPLVDAVLASTSIPGVFPPVLCADRYLVDGGLAVRTGVAQAVDLGATEIYVLPTGSACALEQPPRSAVGMALHALTLLLQQRTIAEIAGLQNAATIKLLPPPCPLAVSAGDFTRARELVERSLASSSQWLTSGGVDLPHPERFLALHRHHPTAPTLSAAPPPDDDYRRFGTMTS